MQESTEKPVLTAGAALGRRFGRRVPPAPGQVLVLSFDTGVRRKADIAGNRLRDLGELELPWLTPRPCLRAYWPVSVRLSRNSAGSPTEFALATFQHARAARRWLLARFACYRVGVNSFQCPSETISRAPSTTLMAV